MRTAVNLYMARRESFHYSVTCRSDEESVLHCLKALAGFAEGGGHKKTAWAEEAVAEWDREDHRLTLRFTTPTNRSTFRRLARDLLAGRWAEYSACDSDPPPALGSERPRERRTMPRRPAESGVVLQPELDRGG